MYRLILTIKQRIKQSEFIRSVLTLSSGIVIGQGINFLGMPLISRIYDPAALGDYTLITADAGIISAVVTLSMLTSVMLPKEDDEARGLCRLVSGAILLLSTFAAIILLLLETVIQVFHTSIPYSQACIVLWAYVISSNLQSVCYSYANRKKLYRVMFWNPILGAGVTIVSGIVMGLLGWGFLGYTLAHILGFTMCFLLLLLKANPYACNPKPENRSLALLKKYVNFPKYQMPANLISSVANQLPVQMLSTVFGATVLGIYSMAMRILSLPISLLSGPINRVYFREVAVRYNEGRDIGEFTFNLLKANIKLALVPVMLLIVFGEPLFAVFLGEKWREAGTYAAILGAYQLMVFCSNCMSGGLVVMGRQRINLILSSLNMVMNLMVFMCCANYFSDSIITALMVLSGSNIIYKIFSQGVFLYLANVSIMKYIVFIVSYIFIPTVIAVCFRSILYTWVF